MKKIFLGFIIVLMGSINVSAQFQRMAISKGTYSIGKKSQKNLTAFCLDSDRPAPDRTTKYANILSGAQNAFIIITQSSKQIKMSLEDAISKNIIAITGAGASSSGDHTRLSFENKTNNDIKIEFGVNTEFSHDKEPAVADVDALDLKPIYTSKKSGKTISRAEAHHEKQTAVWNTVNNNPKNIKLKESERLVKIKKEYIEQLKIYIPGYEKYITDESSIMTSILAGETFDKFQKVFKLNQTASAYDLIGRSSFTEFENLKGSGIYNVLSVNQTEGAFYLFDGLGKPIYVGESTPELINSIRNYVKNTDQTTYLNIDQKSFNEEKTIGLKASLNLNSLKVNSLPSEFEVSLFTENLSQMKQITDIQFANNLYFIEYEIKTAHSYTNSTFKVQSASRKIIERIVIFFRDTLDQVLGKKTPISAVDMARKDLREIFKDDPSLSDVDYIFKDQFSDNNFFGLTPPPKTSLNTYEDLKSK